MEQYSNQPIAQGAVVEATDGLIGTVNQVIWEPTTNQLAYLIVDNDPGDKQFKIPANLVAGQIGTQVVHLNIGRGDLEKHGVEVKIDTNTPNFGHPNLPMPK